MVQPKENPNKNWLQKVLDDVDERNPVIATRYFVVEVTPSVRYWQPNADGHGHGVWEWTTIKQDIVSPYYEFKTEANTWLDEHIPDEGKTLKVSKQDKRRTVIERWW